MEFLSGSLGGNKWCGDRFVSPAINSLSFLLPMFSLLSSDYPEGNKRGLSLSSHLNFYLSLNSVPLSVCLSLSHSLTLSLSLPLSTDLNLYLFLHPISSLSYIRSLSLSPSLSTHLNFYICLRPISSLFSAPIFHSPPIRTYISLFILSPLFSSLPLYLSNFCLPLSRLSLSLHRSEFISIPPSISSHSPPSSISLSSQNVALS